jgi:hypothetical protein
MKLPRNWTAVAAFLTIICGFGIQVAMAKGSRPQICYRSWFDHSLMDRLAAIAFAEAKKKKIKLQGYAGFIAVKMESYRHGKHPIYGLRFTPFACNEMGTDGGGFDIEVDRKTLEVIDSYHSTL